MSRPDLPQVQRLFERAWPLPADQRAEFLARECGDDAALRAEVESLIAHDGQAGSEFLHANRDAVPPEATQRRDAKLSSVGTGDPTATCTARAISAGAPTSGRAHDADSVILSKAGRNVLSGIDGYNISGVIGYGGMGVVYDAKDTRLDRRVAIKTIGSSPNSGERRADF